MVMVEGKGMVRPSQYKTMFSPGEVQTILHYANKRQDYRGYASRTDQWGKGLLGNIVVANVGVLEPSAAPAAAGMIGEYAFACFINGRCGEVCQIDTNLRQFGDGGIDLSPCGLNIDVKARLKESGGLLLRAMTEGGFRLQWKCDVFAFCFWDCNYMVAMDGWVWAKDVANRELVPARVGSHWNIEVEPEELLPMTRLADEIRSRK